MESSSLDLIRYYLPGCGVCYVSWFQGVEERAAVPARGKSPRSNCSACGKTRVIRFREDGLKFCSNDCKDNFDPLSRKSRNRVPHELPSQSFLLELLAYDPTTGHLYWNKGRNRGKRAFSSRQTSGYYAGKIEGKPYLAHRVIWKMVHGQDPDVVDHINCVKSDNRIENLRSVSQKFNVGRHFGSSLCNSQTEGSSE